MWRGSEREPCAGRGSFSFIIIYKVSECHKCGSDDWKHTGHVCHEDSGLCASTMCLYHVQVHPSSTWLGEFMTIVPGVCNLTSAGCGCLQLHTRKTFVPSFLVPWAKRLHFGKVIKIISDATLSLSGKQEKQRVRQKMTVHALKLSVFSRHLDNALNNMVKLLMSPE